MKSTSSSKANLAYRSNSINKPAIYFAGFFVPCTIPLVLTTILLVTKKTTSPTHHAAKLYSLKGRTRLNYLISLPNHLEAKTLALLNQATRSSLLNSMTDLHVGQVITTIPEDEAVDFLQLLPSNRHQSILDQIDPFPANKIKTLLKFGPASSGGLMDLNFIIIDSSAKISSIGKMVGDHLKLHKQAPTIIVKSSKTNHILGYIPYRQLIINSPSTPIKKLVTKLPTVKSHTHQSTLIKKAHHLSADTLAVVDDQEQIIGVIHLHDLLKVIHDQTTANLYHFAGVDTQEDISDSVPIKIKHRLKWLIVNLFTAFLASSVVSIFEPTIEKLALLAVFMPLVAGQGSNAAMQTLAVTIRGIALNNLPLKSSLGIIGREVAAGLINGFVVALVAIPIAFLFHAPLSIGLVLAAALITNLFVAALFGTATPFILKSLNIDPAVASSVFVTTATDVLGFLVLLSLATHFIL